MGRVTRKGAEQARNQLPELLDAAEKGRTTIITKRGRPVAALVPLDAYAGAKQQQAITSLERSGRGLWGRDSVRRIRKLRDEWDR